MNQTAGLTVVIAAIATWIAYQQFQTARHRLRLDLFEKRMEVYEATISLIQLAIRDGNLQLENIFEFVRDTRQAQFLFDKPLLDYLERLRHDSIQFRYLNEKLHEERVPIGEERNRIVDEESTLLKWYIAQAQGDAAEQFRPYLSFHDVSNKRWLSNKRRTGQRGY